LRGLAIVGVLLFHTGRLPGGFLGVDLFFALSGYLITELLLGEVSLVAFWGRRVRRLLPALATMVVVVTVVVWFLGPPDLVRTALADGPWVQLNLVNWHLLAESASYWDRFGPGRVFEHLWSIAVEEQFYLVWPALVLLLARLTPRPDRWVAVSAAVLSAGSLALMIVLVDPADPTRVYTGTDTRAFSLLLGALVAVRPVRAALVRATGSRTGLIAGVLAVAVGALWFLAEGLSSTWLFFGGLFGYSLLTALLIALCAESPETVVSQALSWRPLRWLGLVSYSLYLWHWPVVVMLSVHWVTLSGWPRTLVVCTVSTALAAVSKYLVEDPVRFQARWARGRRGVVSFAASMVLLAVLWATLPAPAPPAVDVSELG
jgi:peptidoglycan/LPS O-acetylase OafA/YrhL